MREIMYKNESFFDVTIFIVDCLLHDSIFPTIILYSIGSSNINVYVEE